MTDAELDRMRAYAAVAREHPTWSVAYAQDVPKLLAAVEACKAAGQTLWGRLRFLEMILDRADIHLDGVPWREAARLSESLDGEPVTEPVAPASNPGVSS